MCAQFVPLHIEEFGSGPAVIFLHGFGANLHTWQDIWPQLSKTNRVILIDLKGFGKSPIPKDNKYSIIDQSNLIAAWIKEKNLENITLVGHSLGGSIALFTALQLNTPQKFPTVARLILLDSAAYVQRFPNFIRALRIPFLGNILLKITPARLAVSIVLKTVFFDRNKISKKLISIYASNLKRPNGKYALLKTAQQIIPQNLQRTSENFSLIKLPTLLIWGDHDKVVPLEVAKHLNSALTQSELVMLNNCGHAPQEEKPIETYELIKAFLSKKN